MLREKYFSWRFARIGACSFQIRERFADRQTIENHTMNTTQQTVNALRAVVSATIDSIREAGPTGAPAGVIYAALMAYGCNLNQFESLISALERAGKIRRSGDLLFAI